HQYRAYAYLLGAYFGDGYVATVRRTHVLRIDLNRKQTAVITDVRAATETVLPDSHVATYDIRASLYVDVCCYFVDWPSLFARRGAERRHHGRSARGDDPPFLGLTGPRGLS